MKYHGANIIFILSMIKSATPENSMPRDITAPPGDGHPTGP